MLVSELLGDPGGMHTEVCPAPVPTALCHLWVRSYVFIKPVFINYKGQTFPAAEIQMPGVSYFLAGGEGSRFSHRVSFWHWLPTVREGMLSSELKMSFLSVIWTSVRLLHRFPPGLKWAP